MLKVKGNDVSKADMGRIIDPYVLEDKEPSRIGRKCKHTRGKQRYILFHSIKNGIAIKKSSYFRNLTVFGTGTTALGQRKDYRGYHSKPKK